MAGTIILEKSGSAHLCAPGQTVQYGDKLEFDSITERWYFPSGIPANYKAGVAGKPNAMGGKWICLGPSDIEPLPGGAVIATISYKGLIDTGTQKVAQETVSIKEVSWDSLSGGPLGTGNNHRATTRDLSPGYSVKTLGIVEKSPPGWTYNSTSGTVISGKITLTNTDFTAADPVGQIAVNTDASHQIWNIPWGWIPTSWEQTEPLPGFFATTSNYVWIPKVSFG